MSEGSDSGGYGGFLLTVKMKILRGLGFGEGRRATGEGLRTLVFLVFLMRYLKFNLP